MCSFLSVRLSSLAIAILLLPSCFGPAPVANRQCDGGRAGGFACHQIDLAAFVPKEQLTTGNLNDIWGWRDVDTGRQFALVGTTTGTTFVEVSNPIAPVVLGSLPAHGFWVFGQSAWRDIKVFEDHAYIVSEANDHGMQIFDLRQLLDVDTSAGPVTFAETGHYEGGPTETDSDVAGVAFHQPLVRTPAFSGLLSNTHNIAINQTSGYAYLVGTSTCDSGLHMVDLRTPDAPVFAGCFDEIGYIHDVDCVIYAGPDLEYVGREICVAFNGEVGNRRNHIAFIDVTDKSEPTLLSRIEYPGSSYSHQGVFDPSHSFVLMGDEYDEIEFSANTRTLIWDARDLAQPSLVSAYEHGSRSSDHNMYFARGLLFQANYSAGVRVLAPRNLANGELEEVAYFDTYSPHDDAGFFGAWTVFPYLSNVLIASSIEEGLFVLIPQSLADD